MKSVLVFMSPRGVQSLFGRPNLERVLITCERAGAHRFFVVASPEERASLAGALGRFDRDGRIRVVDSPQRLLKEPIQLNPGESCLALRADAVFARSQLDRLLRERDAKPNRVVKLGGPAEGTGAMLVLGPWEEVVKAAESVAQQAQADCYAMPFALGEGRDAGRQAETAVARALRHETAEYDGLMARTFDRRVSWRISYRLARTSVTPNQITIANTVLGLIAAALFTFPGYWMRLLGALLFLISVTIDGVDGEVARLKMAESAAGKRLDVLTDNVVNVAIFVGLLVGCYRASGSSAFLYLLPLLLGGFVLCAVAVKRALSITGAYAERWIGNVERICGRDFAYLLMLLAVVGKLHYFAWGSAFGTYIFALCLWWLTNNQAGIAVGSPHPKGHPAAGGL